MANSIQDFFQFNFNVNVLSRLRKLLPANIKYMICILREVPGLHSGGTRMSDHKCIKAGFQINLRGPDYWKFNTSLLDDNGYVTAMKGLLDNFGSKENAHDTW